MDLWIDLFLEALLDCLKMLPFLFAAYLLIEYVEQYQSAKLQKALSRNSRFGFVVGGALGLFPQCGFSAMAANLYSGRVITPGTLLAVFLSTSDEALPLLLASGDGRTIVALLGLKFLLAVAAGFVLDKLVAHRGWGGFSGRQEDCDCHDHHENENVFLAALRHTLHVFILVFGLTLALAAFMELVGQDWMYSLLNTYGFLQVPLAALIGFVPNCAVSVLLMQLYTDGLLSFGALFAGLCTGAGVGLIVLWRTNPNKKENLKLMGILFVAALLGGYLVQLIF